MDQSSINQRLEQLNQEMSELGDELIKNIHMHRDILRRRDAWRDGLDVESVHPDELTKLAEDRDGILARSKRIMNETDSLIDLRSRLYSRPTGGIASLFNKFMPQQKQGFIAIHPLKQELAKLPSVHGRAIFATLTGAVVFMSLAAIWPWMAVGTGTYARDLLMTTFGLDVTLATIVVFGLFFSAMIWQVRHIESHTAWPSSGVGVLASLSVRQEHYFRLGAEKWSLLTQAWVSCMFALRFVVFLVPVAGLIALAVYGFVLTRMYIKTYRKNESVDEAILTTIKINAASIASLLIVCLLYVAVGVVVWL